MRFFIQLIITIWLLFLYLWISLVRFNKFDNINILDCDTDAEAVLKLFLILLWLTTLFIWGINLIIIYRKQIKPFLFIGTLSATLSIGFIPQFLALIQYETEISQLCP